MPSQPSTAVRGHPRPQLQRDGWRSLNGPWDFALDPDARWTRPAQVEWAERIRVPFAPETSASGIGDTAYHHACWYRRTFDAPALAEGERLLLHFGAVDYAATVWVNDIPVAQHEGGYTPFRCDITEALHARGAQTIVVRAHDDPHDLAKPRGKQDWQLEPHAIWYPRTTGIWQTVWLEHVARTWVDQLRWTPNLERWEIAFHAQLNGEPMSGARLRVKLHIDDHLLADDTCLVIAGEVHRRIALSDPGIDDYRNALLWSPTSPTLIQADLELRAPNGKRIDRVTSYTALRSIGVQGDRFVLNGRPLDLRMVLDQGYWPDTGITPPDEAAIQRDLGLVKAMGFNGVRRHQQVPDPRFLYWADRLGVVVWAEMPSAYRFTQASVRRVMREWTDVIQRDFSHPCIVAWVPINESWGVPNLPDAPAQRHYVQGLYHLTRTLDPTRPVIGNDGWESVATDIIGIHDYDPDPERMRARYGDDAQTQRLFQRERPGGRMLLINADHENGQPVMLSEFGGIALADDREHTWGYCRATDSRDLARRYAALMDVVRELPVITGFCYTQFTDTYQEANGLLYADRTPKFPLDQIARATCGPDVEHQRQLEMAWRQRIMSVERYHYVVPAQDHHTTDDH
ncbi:MAG: glycoside hydrolase family 2 protein [Phycisphaeraceae bacterium]